MSEIRKLTKSEYPDAFPLIQRAVAEETRGGWSVDGAAGVLSFLKERLWSFPVFGLFDADLEAVLVYEETHIILLAVKKENQKKGYGKELLAYFIRLKDRENYPRITVHAAVGAVPFYQKIGFEACEGLHEEDGLSYQTMEYLLGTSLLGKEVKVIVDHPLGSFHPLIADEIYPVNTGYIAEKQSEEGNLREAYVLGVGEPVEEFTGYVAALIYRKDGPVHAVVLPAGMQADKEMIVNDVAFEEQYYDTRIIMKEEK